MSKIQRNIKSPFFLNNERAMVSLGPLSNKRYCPYNCAWCYVQDDFNLYAKLNINEIVEFLKSNRVNYKIIYVSGDTDSFAPPRTNDALQLLYDIAKEVKCDLLFTTRTIFSKEHFIKLQQIVHEQNVANRMFYACISITRYSEKSAYLEPHPIPLPEDRILTLKRLKEIGATTVLALRPFLPMIDVNDYLAILDKSKEFIDIVLGEDLYFIRGGNLEKRLFPKGISPEIEPNIRCNQKMLFDDNTSLWDIWHSDEYEQTVSARCKELGIVFSMHSDSAISEYSNNIKNVEQWDLFNEKREKTGETIIRGKPIPQGQYHLVAGAWIKNSQGQFLISQRHPSRNYPNYWECTGGSIRAGENSLDGAIREVYEELGILLHSGSSLLFHQSRRDKMQDFYDAWLFHADLPISSLKLQSKEVSNAKWVDKDTLYEMYLSNEIHPLIDYIEKIMMI